MGIPTAPIVREGFGQIAANAIAATGLPAEAPIQWLFPGEMLNAGVDVTPYVNESIDKVVSALTKWQPKITAKGVYAPAKVTVQGKDYSTAVFNMNNLFLKNMWGDGLPIVPPTEELVNWILTGTDLARDAKIGSGIIPNRAGIATTESLAICMAMAGGRPEYLPVLIAAVEALTNPKMLFGTTQATHASNFPVIIVNGPMAAQIRLYGGHGCMGPDPLHPAAGPIGRAIRLMQIAMGGAVAGIGTVGMYGGGRATNAVFAEDEEGYPKGWPTIAVERGFAPADNVVTANAGASMRNSGGGLIELALAFGVPTGNYLYPNTWPDIWNGDFDCGCVFVGRKTAATYASVNKYSKADVKRIIWENSHTPWDTIVKIGLADRAVNMFKLPAGKPVPITPRPEQIVFGVAGGSTGGHGYIFHAFLYNERASAKIKLPAQAKWDALLKQAEADLGPPPPPMMWA